MAELLAQDKVDALVEQFYRYLLKEDAFTNMFAERDVDIERLKERQRVFIARMVNENTNHDQQSQQEQVKSRHKFQMDPERAEIWLRLMKQSIDDMAFSTDVTEALKAKMEAFVSGMLKG